MSVNVPQVSPLDGTVGGVGATLLEGTALGAGVGILGPYPTSGSLLLLPACGQRWDRSVSCHHVYPTMMDSHPSGIISQTKLSLPQVVYAHGASLSSRKETNVLPTIQNPLASSNAFYFSFPVG